MPISPVPSENVVLITGCSSGIGQAAAALLAHAGYCVYATARRAAAVDALHTSPEGRTRQLLARRLDVTDAASITAVVDEIQDRHGGIDVLINNAGYGQIGAVEEVPCELWRNQMEVNFIGAVAVTQACLAGMRARRRGRIINISSVVAHVALPLMGPYCASKHALDAFSVALRIEMLAFGIEVVLIEPGPVGTRFRENADELVQRAGIGTHTAYASLHRVLHAYWQSRLGRQNTTSAEVAACIAHAVRARRPRLRYRISPVARWLPGLLAILPERWLDASMRRRIRHCGDIAGIREHAGPD